jgi:hypothetical protein
MCAAALAAACGGGAGALDGAPAAADGGAPAPEGGPPPAAALAAPGVIDLPFVTAGQGGSEVTVTLRNAGGADAVGPGGGGLVFSLAGPPSLTVASAPAVVPAGGAEGLTLAYAGADEEEIARAVLTIASAGAVITVPVFAVAGSAALGTGAWETVTGPGGVTCGAGLTVSLPAAPFPDADAPWTDDHVRIFVPEGYRDLADQDVVVHFHGWSTTLAETLAGHHYQEHVWASGANVLLVVPQGPLDAQSGNFGKLMTTGGLAALVDEVLMVLYRDGVLAHPVAGEVTLTSHSGGYQAAAANLGPGQSLCVTQVGLFDSLYGYAGVFGDFALGGGVLRSNYTSGGGTRADNEALAAQLAAAGLEVATTATQAALTDAPVVIGFADSTHTGSTRLQGIYGEELRWSARHHRRGPRIELRQAVARGGVAIVTWLAPRDDELTGFQVEVSGDGVAWTAAASAAADAREASFPLAAGARVRVAPLMASVPPEDVLRSDTYRVDPDGSVLVVDGFDRVIDGSFGGLAHDFAAVVGEAAGGVVTIAHRAITEEGFDLTPYRAVLWLAGDQSVDDRSVTPAEQDALRAYVAAGGGLVVSGSEVAYDLDAGGHGLGFLQEVLGATLDVDDAGSTSVTGAGPLAALGAFGFGGAGAPYVEDYPDALLPRTGAEVLLRYTGGRAAAVGVAHHTALVGFPLELVDDPAALRALVTALLAYVGP